MGPFTGVQYPKMITRFGNGKFVVTGQHTTEDNALYYLENMASSSWPTPRSIITVSGMPTSPPGFKVFLSRKFNRYYYVDSAGTGFWYSAVGAPTGWTQATGISMSGAQGFDRIFETENFLCLVASNILLYRSTDGINFSAVTIPSSVNLDTNSGNSMLYAVNGKTVIARTQVAGEYIAASSDEGLTWNLIPVNQSGSTFTTTGNTYVNTTSEGFMACNASGNIYYVSKDGLVWERLPNAPHSLVESISLANDSAFWLSTISSPAQYTKTATSGLVATSRLASPFGGTTPVTINQLGTGFILVGGRNSAGLNTSICYTSPDGATWTQYNLPQQGVWYGMIGGTTGDNTLLWDSTNRMFLELQENSTITLS
jgi:hypothetical protein